MSSRVVYEKSRIINKLKSNESKNKDRQNNREISNNVEQLTERETRRQRKDVQKIKKKKKKNLDNQLWPICLSRRVVYGMIRLPLAQEKVFGQIN